MRKVIVTVPAVSTNLGPGLGSLGLALGLHVTAAFLERNDTQLLVETHGEGGSDLSPDCYHPVMYAAVRVFQRVEDAPLGLRVDVRNRIPVDVGLGAEDAMTVAGLVGANNLLGMPLSREELVLLGGEILDRADGVAAAMLGGLVVTARTDQRPVFRRVNVPTFKVLLVTPQLDSYAEVVSALPDSVSFAAALKNLGRQALVVEALRSEDFELLGSVLMDDLLEPGLVRHIPAFAAARQAALDAGAVGVTISGRGPSLVVFATGNHYRIADAVQSVFDEQGVLSRVWTVPVDTQGVVVTAADLTPG